MDGALTPSQRRRARALRGALLGAAIVAVALAGCSGDGGRSSGGASTDSATSTVAPTFVDEVGGCGLPPGRSELEISGGPADRVVTVVAPDVRIGDGGTAPLIVDLHGYSESSIGHGSVDGFVPEAVERGVVVATPDALGSPSLWNATEIPGLPDDVAFIGQLLELLLDSGCIDHSRVAVVGGSNGAFMASTVGCRLANLVTTVAPVAGAILPTQCRPALPVSVLAIHGDADRLVPIAGGLGPDADDLPPSADALAVFSQLPVIPVPQALAEWAALAGCDTAPRHAGSNSSVERTEWVGCDGGAIVRLDVIRGAGHVWPGSAALASIGVDERSAAMAENATDEIIRFVLDHPRRR